MQRKLDSFPDSVSEPKSRRESSELEKEETDSGKAGTIEDHSDETTKSEKT